MTVLGYVVGILLVIGMGIFAVAAFIIANIEQIEREMSEDE